MLRIEKKRKKNKQNLKTSCECFKKNFSIIKLY